MRHAALAQSGPMAGMLQSDVTAEKSRRGCLCETNVFSFWPWRGVQPYGNTSGTFPALSVTQRLSIQGDGGGFWVGWRWQGWILSAALCPCRMGPAPRWSHEGLPSGESQVPLVGEVALSGLCPVWHTCLYIEAVFHLTLGPVVLYVLNLLFWLNSWNMKPKQRISETLFHFLLISTGCKLVLLGGHLASVLSSWFPRDREGRDAN